jgi:HEAT repeat protein
MLDVVLDVDASLNDRCKAARTLVKGADTETLLALKGAFLDPDSPGHLKAAIVEGLGYSSDPQAKEFILSALEDKDDVVVRGAIRGLSVIGDNDAISELSNILLSTDAPHRVVLEAAMGLGRIDLPGTYEILVGAYHDATILGTEDFKEGILAALGQRRIAETAAFFQEILDDSTTPSSLRIAVIEAVEDAQGDTSPFLLNNLRDKESEVRAAVASALAIVDEPGNVAGELQTLLAEEKDADVRKRLYEALGNQKSEDVDIDSVAVKIFAESDLEARLAGYSLLAEHVRTAENAVLQEQFETIAVPSLRETALTADRLSTRLSAVIALKKTGTAKSRSALEEIAAVSSDERVVKATGISDK